MDRNDYCTSALYISDSVATREGGVDRNTRFQTIGPDGRQVATREGGVDRNLRKAVVNLDIASSPPARVAWIETLEMFLARQR